MLPAGAHPAAPLLSHAAEHRDLITLPQGMEEEERDAATRYGNHAYARKDEEFIHVELAEKVQAEHVAVFPLEEVTSF